jgi:hypothetical protein
MFMSYICLPFDHMMQQESLLTLMVKTIVSSYVSTFESLWNQTELYEELKRSNRQLADLYKQVIATLQVRTY